MLKFTALIGSVGLLFEQHGPSATRVGFHDLQSKSIFLFLEALSHRDLRGAVNNSDRFPNFH